MIKYSFVLPAYKARFFREAIDSILAQTYTDFELIIVNDASPEDLDAIVRSYDDPRIRYYVNEQNIGGKDLVAQWNHCLEYAQGEYVILASDDDVYFPQYLEKMDALVCKYPDVNVFRPRVQRINEKGKIIRLEGFLNEKLSQIEYIYAWVNGHIGSGIPFFIFRNEVLKSVGGFVKYPLAWFSDDATVISLAKNDMVVTNEVLFSFRISGINISSRRQTKYDVLSKIEATKSFYQFIKTEIGYIKCENDFAEAMKKDVAYSLDVFLKESVMSFAMVNQPLRGRVKIIKNLLKLEFIHIRTIIRFWLFSIINKNNKG